MLFWTPHANFGRVENGIYDPSARITKDPLNSTILWTRHLNSATRQLNSTTRQKFTLKYSSLIRQSVISTWRRVENAYYDPNGLP